ncbi:hypothetical protein RIVM261_078390 [Rivularia sp. IAM M-261]|nr:hypothetical protein RIVM261_078390 [Rivularia sp. IAM M-261]
MQNSSTIDPSSQELILQKKTKNFNKPRLMIPDEDMEWALSQRLPVYRLWGECWRSDPNGVWVPLQTSMGMENFRKAKKPLIDAGLFLFETRMTVINGKCHYQCWVKNLHGCKQSERNSN